MNDYDMIWYDMMRLSSGLRSLTFRRITKCYL